MQGFSPIRLVIIKLLLFYQWFIPGLSFAQNENTVTAQQLRKPFINTDNYGIIESSAGNPIMQVDSIAHTSTIASYFCKAYSNSMKNIAMQIKNFDLGAKVFIQKFEVGFADYFLTPFYANTNGNLLNGSVWKCFYSCNQAKPWQLVLLGVNAHINGDLWQVLVDNFSEQEIRRYKREMLATQSSIAKVYDDSIGISECLSITLPSNMFCNRNASFECRCLELTQRGGLCQDVTVSCPYRVSEQAMALFCRR